jgi:hypothetical protein
MSPLLQRARSGTWSWRAVVTGFALPAAMLLAALLALGFHGAPVAASETLFLALWAAAVFLPLSLLETASRPVHAALALAVTVLVTALPRSGGLRPAAVAAALALTVLLAAGLLCARRAELGLRPCAALALAMAIVLHGHRFFLHGFAFETVALLAVVPGIAATLAARLAAAGRPGAGLFAALALLGAPQLASEPWWVVLAFATAGFAASFGAGAGARLAQRSLFLFASATLLAGAFPWLRAAPVATVLGALSTLARPVAETPLGDRVVVLTQAAPRFAVELSGDPVRSLVLDSYLTHGVELACGQELAGLELAGTEPAGFEVDPATGVSAARRPASARRRGTLVAGRDSAEWAAGRPDVEAQLACPAPTPWISWMPASGRFLGQTTRARIALEAPFAAHSLVLERNPALPAETALAIFFVATER